MSRDFTVVFEKLKEQQATLRWSDPKGQSDFEVVVPLQFVAEVDRLAELRRLVDETMDIESPLLPRHNANSV
jgi:hypothetical protein